jgi:hypothetical protein
LIQEKWALDASVKLKSQKTVHKLLITAGERGAQGERSPSGTNCPKTWHAKFGQIKDLPKDIHIAAGQMTHRSLGTHDDRSCQSRSESSPARRDWRPPVENHVSLTRRERNDTGSNHFIGGFFWLSIHQQSNGTVKA